MAQGSVAMPGSGRWVVSAHLQKLVPFLEMLHDPGQLSGQRWSWAQFECGWEIRVNRVTSREVLKGNRNMCVLKMFILLGALK